MDDAHRAARAGDEINDAGKARHREIDVGKKVTPPIVNSRRGKSSRTSGLPATFRYGMAKNTTMSTYANARRRTENLPCDGFGRIHRREPSTLSWMSQASLGCARSAARAPI